MNSGELPTFILGVAAAIAGAAALAGKDRRSRAPVAALCVVLIIGAVILAVTTTPWFTSSDTASANPAAPAMSTSTTSTTTTTETSTTTTIIDEPAETTTPLVESISLPQGVPSPIASTCEAYRESQETLVRGLVDELTCRPPDGPFVQYLQYTNADAMEKAFVRHHGEVSGESCADGSDLGRYKVHDVPRGEWACYVSTAGKGVMLWTDSRYLVLGILSDADMTAQDAYDWFFDHDVALYSE